MSKKISNFSQERDSEIFKHYMMKLQANKTRNLGYRTPGELSVTSGHTTSELQKKLQCSQINNYDKFYVLLIVPIEF